MCGILFHISSNPGHQVNPQSLSDLSRRGPDTLHTVARKVTTNNNGATWYLNFAASVLWLRGTQPHLQPLVDEATESVLCWNGEAWLFDDKPVRGNDSAYIFRQLLAAAAAAPESGPVSVVDVLDKIKGPYAFVFFDGRSKQVFYGRDVLGRRSLLASAPNTDQNTSKSVLTISSLTTSNNTPRQAEVGTAHIHVVDLNESDLSVQAVSGRRSIADINANIPRLDEHIQPCPSIAAVDGVLEKLSTAVRRRVEAIPSYNLPASTANLSNPSKVAILFSGGLDCTLLARLSHDVLPQSEPIDLLNVAFENPRVARARIRTQIRAVKDQYLEQKSAVLESTSGREPKAEDLYEFCPDRMTGRSSFTELVRICPSRLWRFVAINIPYVEYKSHSPTITALMAPHNTEMDHSITAALYFAARGCGQATLSTDLLDLQHTVERPGQEQEVYTTPSRVLLSGLGADELFAGYTRHATSFSRSSWHGLISELALDISRIAARNLGRDDRVITHWARETRFPFLDEDFVNYTLQLPVWEKCGYRTTKPVKRHFEGTTEARVRHDTTDLAQATEKAETVLEQLDPAKMVLRIALWRLGMRRAAQEKKRAIQFGTRSAKMEVGSTRGTDVIGTS